MKICVITDKTVQDVTSLPECDMAVFGFTGVGDVDYESELNGETDKFEDVCRLSKQTGGGIISGCRTKSYGMKRKSACVADGGKLLGISDMVHVFDDEELKSGAGFGVYTVCGYKLGLCIENDLYFPEGIKALSLCGCNAVVVIMEELKNTLPPLLIRAYSYLYGMPVILCAGRTAFFAETNGEVASSTQPCALFDISLKNRYHLITTRQKGLSGETKADY